MTEIVQTTAYELFTVLAIAVAWFILAGVWLGWGLIAIVGVRRVEREVLDARLLTNALWSGLIAMVLFALAWHFLAPLGHGPALVAFALPGLLGLAYHSPNVVRWWRYHWHAHRKSVVIFLLLVFYIAHHAAGGIGHYDTGLYHLTAVQWARQFGIVPGLANLHSRLGFNNATHLLHAMVEVGFFLERSRHLLIGLMVCVLLASGWPALHRLLVEHKRDWETRLLAVFAGLAVFLATFESIANLSTDLPVAILTFAIIAMLVRLIRAFHQPTLPWRQEAVLIALLSTVIVTFKLSGLAFALASWAVAAIALFRLNRRANLPISAAVKPLSVVVAISALLSIAWLARGIVLSGYPFYPAPVLGFDFDWRVPHHIAEAQAIGVRYFARAGVGEVMPVSEWLPIWFTRYPPEDLSVQLLTAAALGAIALKLRRRHRGDDEGTTLTSKHHRRIRFAMLTLPIGIGLAFWAYNAPDPRFALGLLYGIVALVVAQMLSDDWLYRNLPKRLGLATLVFIAGLAVLGTSPDRFVESNEFGHRPQINYKTKMTPAGKKIYIPSTVADTGRTTEQAWGGPLTTTPEYVPGLRLRNPENLAKGFKIASNARNNATQPAR
jgi:hypothetical protein